MSKTEEAIYKSLGYEGVMPSQNFVDAVTLFCQRQKEHNETMYKLLKDAKDVMLDHQKTITQLNQRILMLEACCETELPKIFPAHITKKLH